MMMSLVGDAFNAHIQSVRLLSSLLLNIVTDVELTTSWGKLFQILTTLRLKKFFRTSSRERWTDNFKLWPLVLWLFVCRRKKLSVATLTFPVWTWRLDSSPPKGAHQPPTFRPRWLGQTVAHISYCWALVVVVLWIEFSGCWQLSATVIMLICWCNSAVLGRQ